MSLSTTQAVILELLQGTERRLLFKEHPGLDIPEIAAELLERGVFDERTCPKKQLLHTVRRACSSLADGGLIEGVFKSEEDSPWSFEFCWTATNKK